VKEKPIDVSVSGSIEPFFLHVRDTAIKMSGEELYSLLLTLVRLRLDGDIKGRPPKVLRRLVKEKGKLI